MTPIGNVKLANPSTPSPNWPAEAVLWTQLNNDIGGSSHYSPLTIKAIYVTGVIYQICESVSFLLSKPDFARQITYIPAVGLYASGIEILGRCVKGESSHWKSSLLHGLKWLKSPVASSYSLVPKTDILISTATKSYSLEEIESLRNYSAHGQATSQYYALDYQLLATMHPLLVNGLESYWQQIIAGEDLCNNLALANIVPFRGLPILSIILSKNPVIKEIFQRFNNEYRV